MSILADIPWSTIYGIRALQHLATKAESFVALSEIAVERELPRARLSKILQALRRAGLVEGIPGKGYRLGRPVSEIAILSVIQALNGEADLVPACLMKSTGCTKRSECKLPDLCRELDRSTKELLSKFTLDRFPTAGCVYPPSRP